MGDTINARYPAHLDTRSGRVLCPEDEGEYQVYIDFRDTDGHAHI